MTRFEEVIRILDAAVGGPTAPVGFHGAFWRGLKRNQFVAKKIFGLQITGFGLLAICVILLAVVLAVTFLPQPAPERPQGL